MQFCDFGSQECDSGVREAGVRLCKVCVLALRMNQEPPMTTLPPASARTSHVSSSSSAKATSTATPTEAAAATTTKAAAPHDVLDAIGLRPALRSLAQLAAAVLPANTGKFDYDALHDDTHAGGSLGKVGKAVIDGSGAAPLRDVSSGEIGRPIKAAAAAALKLSVEKN